MKKNRIQILFSNPLLKEGPVIKVLVGIFIFIFGIFIIFTLSQTTPIYPKENGYVGVITEANVSYFMGIEPLIDKNLVHIWMRESSGWKNQSRALVLIPSDTQDLSVLLLKNNNSMPISEKIIEKDMLTKSVPYQAYEDLMGSNLTDSINNKSIILKPDLIENYYGIEFNLPNRIIHRSRSQVSISIPIYNEYFENSKNSLVHQVTKYQIHLIIPQNYELISSVPSQFTRFKLTKDNIAIYQYDIDASSMDLLVNLENRVETTNTSLIIMVVTLLLGFSVSLIFPQLIEIISKRKDFKDKHKKWVETRNKK